MKLRLQKILANAGYGSRRSCEEFISQGRVRVNGEIAELGAKADPEIDSIAIDDQPITQPQKLQYYLLHKPAGVISAVKSPDPRPTVRSLIDVQGHLYPVGRLDVESEGLILMTNDGEMTYQLTHPRYQHEKEYRVLIKGAPSDNQLDIWRNGVILEDGKKTTPAKIWIEKKSSKGTWLRVILKEGKKRQIRRMAEALGHQVSRLIRVRIATLSLDELAPGEYRSLTNHELNRLREAIQEKG
jgi:23S rRNA pseudouridine2605 synthase